MALVNGIFQHQAGGIEAQQGDSGFHHNTFQDVSVYMMAEFMGQHRFNLIVAIVLQERIRQDDAARMTQAGKSGIGFLALL